MLHCAWSRVVVGYRALISNSSEGAQLEMSRITTAAIDRSDRSVDRAIGWIDSIDSIFFRIFCHVGELKICLLSKFHVCATLEGPQNAEKPKRKFSESRFGRFGIPFGSIDIGSEGRGGPLWDHQVHLLLLRGITSEADQMLKR